MGKLLIRWNSIFGIEIPREVQIGKNVNFAHNSVGSVIHSRTRIKDNIIIFPGVTIGKADIYEDWKHSKVEGLVIEQGAALCAGAKILVKREHFELVNTLLLRQMWLLHTRLGPMKSREEYLLNV